MKIISKLYMGKVILLLFLIFIIIEIINIRIDIYNFNQLEQVKTFLNTQDKDGYSFSGIGEYNQKYDQNIIPARKCYFISDINRYFRDGNGGGGFIFGFKLESLFFKIIYFNNYYVYPKYNLPVSSICTGFQNGGCKDYTYNNFIKTISNPCK